MDKHSVILIIFLSAALIIAAVFYHVYYSSRLSFKSEGMKQPTRKRYFLFLILAGLVIILLSITLPRSPYFLFADQQPAKVVFVAARQFNFISSYQAIDPKNPGSGEDSIVLPLNETVEFRVTSLDVNHGFAIYNDKAELVMQTQAMPGYVNRLRWKFDRSGVYNILCLEYCGAAHPYMRSSFIVK